MTTTIDFNDLSRGTIVDNEYQTEGVTISAQGGSGKAMIFDTANPTGGDHDLATNNLGKVLIISEDGDSHDPDDNAHGGSFNFVFDHPSSVESLTFLDIEHGAAVCFYDADDNLISYVDVPSTNNNGQLVFHFNVSDVVRMEVLLPTSGAIDNLVFDTPAPAPILDGVVQGTDGDDVIDANYADDPNGDRIDAGDAILPGEGPNDDIVLAGDGKDVVFAGLGDDDVYGGDGNDDLFGEAGHDLIDGGDGDDIIDGGAGDDTLRGANGDDVVEGGAGKDCIEGGAGDDTLLGGDGNDMIDGGAGRDTIDGGTGADAIFAGSDDDTIEGGDGDDVIYGDSAKPGVDGGDVVRESFEWSEFPNQSHVPASFSQDTGNATVTFTTLAQSGGANTDFGTESQRTAGIEDDGTPVDPSSSLDSVLNHEGNAFDFQLEFDKNVSNVSFRINDIDGDGIVKVTAFDADGNKIHIDLDAGDRLTALDTDAIAGADTVDSQGGYEDNTSANYSVLVSIPGPVSRIEIEHDQDGPNNSGITFTDVYFDVATPDAGPDGDDDISGGDGDDTIFGEGGDDTIEGGAGIDTISGGADRDTILGGAGDTVDGGAGGNDFDVLDLTGQGPFFLDNVETDSNGNGINGTVVFVDADGKPNGQTILFTEIEEVRGDNVGAAPNANDDTAATDEDTPVTIDVLANDVDPDGDPLTVTQADSPDGTVTINPDGTLEFTPAPDFNGETTITYTVTDPDGNEDTATVTVSVAPVNDAPDAVDDTAETPQDTPVTVAILDNDIDPDGDPLNVVEATSPDGKVTVNPDGTVTFTPNPGFVGEATVNYTVQDPGGLQDDAIVTITVTDAPDAPVAQDDTGATITGTPVTIDALANDSDPDGDDLTIIAASVPPQQGTVDIVDNQVVFTPAPGFEGPATIDYTIEDEDGLTDDAVITVQVQNGIVNGTDGKDVIDTDFVGDPGGDRVDNNDEVLPGEGPNDDIIQAGAGDDIINSGDGDDEVFGGDGNDTITTGDGSDEVFGGAGDDVIDTDNGSFLIDKGYPGVFTGEEGTPAVFDDRDVVDGGDGDDTIRTGDDNDTIIGGAGNDTIDGGIDDDTIDGGIGNDRIVGGEGNDTIDGGEGDDTIYAGNDPDLGLDQFNIEDDGTNPLGPDLRPDNGQDVVRGGDGNDTIFGADDDDLLFGDAGDDFIDGQIDDDFIDGGSGNDELLGGQGDDTIVGGTGEDFIDAGIGNDFVDGGDDDDIVFGDDGDDDLIGGMGDDQLFGDDGNDILDGGDGNDFVAGGDGDDILVGGAGDDELAGGAGVDDLSGGADRDTFTEVNAGDTIDGGADGDDFDVLDLTGSAPDGGTLTVEFTNPDSNGNGFDGVVTYFDEDGNEAGKLNFTEIEEVIPCFTPGTLVATPRGEVKVEDLEVGDKVITRDNGMQAIRWVGHREMTGDELTRAPHLRPVLIRQGALGNGLPERDMMVSPNHRMLVANDKTALYFEESEVLVSAKHLTALDGVDIVEASGTTYIHIMFDQHEVILSDGTWSESFQPGDMTLDAMGDAQRREILELFPELASRAGIEGYTSARRSLKKHEARLLMQ